MLRLYSMQAKFKPHLSENISILLKSDTMLLLNSVCSELNTKE
jgi:hypothetical protein